MMDDRKQALNRNKMIAVGLLLGASVLFVIARSRQASGPWEWIAAFAEAAMVGALADWFAVVALFRHPLGVPIPHTAIIANKKATIAENLAQFIQDKFLATEVLVEKLKAWDPAAHLCGYLTSRHNAESLAHGLSRVISESLDFIEDERVQKVLHEAINAKVEQFDVSSSAAVLIDTLRKDSRHQVVLDELLHRVAAWMSTPESQDKLAAAIDAWAGAEYPMLKMFIPPGFSKGAGEKIIKRVNEFMQAVDADPQHELRHEFDKAVNEFTVKLKYDPLFRAKVDALKLETINNAPLAQYVKSLLGDLKNWMIEDLDRPHSRIQKKLADAAVALGTTLASNKELSTSINDHLEKIVRHYADNLRGGIAKHISGTVKDWKDEDFIEEIELSIGTDLQFIRMNGTLVGGAIGILLHAVSLLLR
jgi:uncharacterized membrane-anchored protein YjiN (DUF445 family)